MRIGTKAPVFVPDDIARHLDRLSKAALMDIAWNLAALACGECDNVALTADRLREEAVIVAGSRRDRVTWKKEETL